MKEAFLVILRAAKEGKQLTTVVVDGMSEEKIKHIALQLYKDRFLMGELIPEILTGQEDRLMIRGLSHLGEELLDEIEKQMGI